jgi:hypothetical protein
LYERDSLGVARHALKVNLMFTLLDRRRMALSDMPTYVEKVGIYRELNAMFFGMPSPQFADMIIGELERSGAAKRTGGWLTPARA